MRFSYGVGEVGSCSQSGMCSDLLLFFVEVVVHEIVVGFSEVSDGV